MFIHRHMRIAPEPQSLRRILAGQSKELHILIAFDLVPVWISLALRHAQAAKRHQRRRDEAWAGTDEDAKVAALVAECEASMQAIVATATAIEALYDVLRPLNGVGPAAPGTSRHSVVGEVLRRSFKLPNAGAKGLKALLKHVYSFRDRAVHPKNQLAAPQLHPELGVAMEWRFVWFRAANAVTLAEATARALWELASRGKPSSAAIGRQQENLKASLDQAVPARLQREVQPTFRDATRAKAAAKATRPKRRSVAPDC